MSVRVWRFQRISTMLLVNCTYSHPSPPPSPPPLLPSSAGRTLTTSFAQSTNTDCRSPQHGSLPRRHDRPRSHQDDHQTIRTCERVVCCRLDREQDGYNKQLRGGAESLEVDQISGLGSLDGDCLLIVGCTSLTSKRLNDQDQNKLMS